MSQYVIIWVVVLLTACSGENDDDNNSNREDDIVDIAIPEDTLAPIGYSVTINSIIINEQNQQSFSFSVVSAEIGSTYEYALSVDGNVGNTDESIISGSGIVEDSEFIIDDIDVSGFDDGILSLSFFLEDSEGNVGDTLRDTVTKVTINDSVRISGSLTYDLVPHHSDGIGLDYDRTRPEPIRGVVVEAIDDNGDLVDATLSDASGNYALNVYSNSQVRIQARARMVQTVGSVWDVSVVDNTNDNAMYVLSGLLADSGDADSLRDLHAPSGWGESSYIGARSAAPFAILSPIYDAMNKFSQVNIDSVFPALEFRWSVNNIADNEGTYEEGHIGTSFYSNGAIYILGAANNDTDEYDKHLIVHEWGHYFEDKISRSDSIGGRHGTGNRLDMRLAFGEGFGNALSGIVTDDSLYRDAYQDQQSISFVFSLENNTHINSGWFNESSVQSILYDLYDSEDDGADTLSLGLGPILKTLTDTDYTQNFWFTTIYSFIEQLGQHVEDSSQVADGIESLLQEQNIYGRGDNGEGETNSGGLSSTLPVYIDMSIAESPFNLCTDNSQGSSNKLGHKVFARINFVTPGIHTLTMKRISGANNLDPDFRLWRSGVVVFEALSNDVNEEVLSRSFDEESLVLVAQEAQGNNACFSFSIEEG